MARQDAKEWLLQAIADANTYDLPYIVKWPDGTYSALSKKQLKDCVGEFQSSISVEMAREALYNDNQVNF